MIAEPVPVPEDPPILIVDPPPPNEPSYPSPPFPSETTCYFFVPCFYFPTEPICCLPKSGCGGPYTFANSCYLGAYNCEHASNRKFCNLILMYYKQPYNFFCYSILPISCWGMSTNKIKKTCKITLKIEIELVVQYAIKSHDCYRGVFD